MVLVGGMDTGWKPGGGRMSEKSSLLSDDAAPSSSEDMPTTAGCREVMCVQRAYANSKHRGVASGTHLRRSLCRIWGGGFPKIVVLSLLLGAHHQGFAYLRQDSTGTHDLGKQLVGSETHNGGEQARVVCG